MDKFIHELFTNDIFEDLIKQFGLTSNEVYKVGGFENYIYGYKRHNQDYILRISHSSHRSLEMIKAELDFVFYLATNNANVSTPVKSINEELVEKVDCNDDSYFTISSYTKALGVPPTKDLVNDVFLYNYGKTIGMFHRLTKDYKESKGIEKRFLAVDDPLILNAKKYLLDGDEIIYQKLMKLLDEIKAIPVTKDNFGLIHTDIHFGNFFVNNNELSVFDFDDCSYFYFVSDIAIALFYYLYFTEEKRDEIGKHFIEQFMKGYVTENIISDEDLSHLDKFLKLREIILYLVVNRSCDINTNKWAHKYYHFYRDRIINDIPFINLK